MKKIFLLFSLLYSINIYSQMISDVRTNITDITFSIYEKDRLFIDTELSKFKVNNEKTLVSFKKLIDSKIGNPYPNVVYLSPYKEKEYSFENDSLILKLKQIQEKSKKWFNQSIELEISDFKKTISDDKYGKFIFYCYSSFQYEILWFLDNTLIATFENNNKLCSISKIIEHILCVNEYIELKKKEELIELKKQKEKQEKIDLLL